MPFRCSHCIIYFFAPALQASPVLRVTNTDNSILLEQYFHRSFFPVHSDALISGFSFTFLKNISTSKNINKNVREYLQDCSRCGLCRLINSATEIKRSIFIPPGAVYRLSCSSFKTCALLASLVVAMVAMNLGKNHILLLLFK